MAGWEQMEAGAVGQGIRTAGLSGTRLAVPGQPDATFGVHRILRLSEGLGCVGGLLRHYGGRRVREANGDSEGTGPVVLHGRGLCQIHAGRTGAAEES